MGIGAAMTGLRVIIEGMNMGFLLLAYNQISNNAGMLHYTSGGQYKVRPPSADPSSLPSHLTCNLQCAVEAPCVRRGRALQSEVHICWRGRTLVPSRSQHAVCSESTWYFPHMEAAD